MRNLDAEFGEDRKASKEVLLQRIQEARELEEKEKLGKKLGVASAVGLGLVATAAVVMSGGLWGVIAVGAFALSKMKN